FRILSYLWSARHPPRARSHVGDAMAGRVDGTGTATTASGVPDAGAGDGTAAGHVVSSGRAPVSVASACAAPVTAVPRHVAALKDRWALVRARHRHRRSPRTARPRERPWRNQPTRRP